MDWIVCKLQVCKLVLIEFAQYKQQNIFHIKCQKQFTFENGYLLFQRIVSEGWVQCSVSLHSMAKDANYLLWCPATFTGLGPSLVSSSHSDQGLWPILFDIFQKIGGFFFCLAANLWVTKLACLFVSRVSFRYCLIDVSIFSVHPVPA